MIVRITKEHCIGSDYGDNYDCPLFRAIREQYSEFPLSWVGGSFIVDKQDNRYTIQGMWNILTFENLLQGLIGPVVLNIPI